MSKLNFLQDYRDGNKVIGQLIIDDYFFNNDSTVQKDISVFCQTGVLPLRYHADSLVGTVK